MPSINLHDTCSDEIGQCHSDAKDDDENHLYINKKGDNIPDSRHRVVGGDTGVSLDHRKAPVDLVDSFIEPNDSFHFDPFRVAPSQGD